MLRATRKPPDEKEGKVTPMTKRRNSRDLAWLPSLSPAGLLLTFKIEVGPTLQKDSRCPSQPQFSHLQQSIAHTFLVERRVRLLLQQLSEGQDAALLAGSITALRGRTEKMGPLGDQLP